MLTFEAFVQQGAPGASVLLLQAGSGLLSASSPQEYCWKFGINILFSTQDRKSRRISEG